MKLDNYTCKWLLLISLTACAQKKKSSAAEIKEQLVVSHYDLAHPEVFKMPAVLNEISGIAFKNGNADTMYAQQDEEGKVFKFHLGSGDIIETKFGKKGDYEDIGISNDDVVMLRSDGTLFAFPFTGTNNKDAANVQEFKKLLPTGEYEGLYADNTNNKLYVLCKQCNAKMSETASIYVLSFKGQDLKIENTVSINVTDIASKSGVKKLMFQPSALAKNNNTGEWYILSSVNKLLVVTTGEFVVKEVFKLAPSLYNQPEGMVFDAGNNLYISNEKGNTNAATVLKLRYKN